MADIKNFLYAWCGKKKLTPNYDIRAAGNKNRQKFLCEVRIRLSPLKANCKLYIKILHNKRCFFLFWTMFCLRCVLRVTITLAWEILPTRRMLSPMQPEILWIILFGRKKLVLVKFLLLGSVSHLCLPVLPLICIMRKVWVKHLLFSGQRTWWREWRRWWWVWKSPIQLSTTSTSDCEEGIGRRYLMFYLYMHPVIGC